MEAAGAGYAIAVSRVEEDEYVVRAHAAAELPEGGVQVA